jgi:hypothetical protein
VLTVADIDPHIQREFGSRLEPLGFQWLGQRKWVRSQKLPVREPFVISALKGGMYSPTWGFSSGFVPSLRSRRFRRQTTDKNAMMDLTIAISACSFSSAAGSSIGGSNSICMCSISWGVGSSCC